MTENTNAENAQQHINWTHDWQTREGDTPETGLATAILATAYAQLAIADQQAETNTLLRTYLDSVNPPAAHDEQLQQDITDEQITSLAATLWQADPGNQNSPAQRFQDDYAHRQDQYLAMARAALGLQDEPRKKDSRRP